MSGTGWVSKMHAQIPATQFNTSKAMDQIEVAYSKLLSRHVLGETKGNYAGHRGVETLSAAGVTFAVSVHSFSSDLILVLSE